MSREISRRTFLTATATIGTAGAGEALLSACNTAPPAPPRRPFTESLTAQAATRTQDATPFPRPTSTIYHYEAPATKTPELKQRIMVPHWYDGMKLRIKDTKLRKFVPITGMGTTIEDVHAFDLFMEKAIYPLNFDKLSVLNPSYRVNMDNPLRGEPYDWSDTTQDPMKSVEKHIQMFEKYIFDFPDDKFWLIGHSQGGFIAYHLANHFRDKVEGLITLSAPLKGANLIPTTIDRRLAPLVSKIIGGQAGTYYLQQGERHDDDEEVEKTCASLIANGMIILPFAAPDDPIVGSPFSFVEHSTQKIGNTTINTKFPMGKWEDSPTTSRIMTKLELDLRNFRDDIPSSREEGMSAQLTSGEKRTIIESMRDGFATHSAPLIHPKVHTITQMAVRHALTQNA